MAKEVGPPSDLDPDEAAQDSAAQADPDDPDEPATVDVIADPLATSGAAVSATQRSMPSVPRVGIPRSLQGWDRYLVSEVLGAGGMGAVYRARDPRLNRMVALKIVHPMLGHTPGSTGQVFVKRFVREARLQASLDHPHICKVYEIGELPNSNADADEGFPYIAMQLIAGKPLSRAAADMSLYEKVRAVQQVAEALHVAHRQGLVHRDIKPSNIMVERTEDGKFHPYVMDFGLARETAGSDHSRSGIIEGTPAYMAPEQARGETKHLDRRVDVYALGVTLYELLVGKLPFKATGDLDILMAVLTQEPQPLRAIDPNIPVDLEAVTLKCLEKEAAARYDSAKALADDLGRYLDGEPVLARRIGLSQRLYRRARKHKPLVALGAALLLSLIGLFVYGVRARLAASQQAALAQKLGQEITKMEWLLRSARQLPLHDLEREKVIIRQRMVTLERELSSYGTRGQGLAHYALGRGHLALHEYPESLAELRQALSQGNDSADVHYALGLVLGKHFEQAMYEARLSGGGDWANKQLKQIEPQYLTPAIASLQKSRALQSDAPGYLEALIAYYQRNYEAALKQAEAAQREAPWLYEASRLSGDIHLERALQARDGGKNEDAEKEFAAAVKSYEEAATVGQSDAEVYEGLAETWVRRIEMAAARGQPTETAYAAAVAASDKITKAEPQSVAGRLKKGYAALMTMASLGGGQSSDARVKECLVEAQAVLAKQPENPYASDVGADCYTFAAGSASAGGGKPEPLFRQAFDLLEPAIRRYPHFLWGLNDLASAYLAYGVDLQLHGDAKTREALEKSLRYEAMAIALDATYLVALQNSLYAFGMLVSESGSEQDLQSIVAQADSYYEKCMKINNQFQQCNINYLLVYARAIQRIFSSGKSPQPQLKTAREILAAIRKIGGSFLDVEQNAALTYLVEAEDGVGHKQDPAPALSQLQAALQRCFAINAPDAMCKTLAAQGDRVEAEWLSLRGQPAAAKLKSALDKAIAAAKSPETYPDAWQVLADTYLRLARSEAVGSKAREAYLAEGLTAVQKVFAINPNHSLGQVTQRDLEALRGAK